jgi:acetylornithine deacetylase
MVPADDQRQPVRRTWMTSDAVASDDAATHRRIARGQVLDFLSVNADAILEFARELIRTPSPNPPGDERAVADLITNRLRQLGVADIVRLGVSDERPNLIVTVQGTTDGPTLMLAGHMDTKPSGDLTSWTTDPLDPVLDAGQLIGLGSGDMKAAVAGMVYSAAALAQVDFPGRLVLVLTADEEAGSLLGSRWLAEQGVLAADAAIIGEPCGIVREWESIHLVSRGVALFRIKLRGTQMHSSISDRLPGINATVEMAKLIVKADDELASYLRFDPHPLCPTGPTVNVGVVAEAGVFFGVYPGTAEFGCDIRTLPGMTEQSVMADVGRFLDDAHRENPNLDAELEWVTMMPACEIPASEPIVRALSAAALEVLGTEPALDAFPGATDAAYFQLDAGIPCVASFGPGLLPRAHSPNEFLAADGPELAARVYAMAALRYLAGDDAPH